jgi:hypothetical protein
VAPASLLGVVAQCKTGGRSVCPTSSGQRNLPIPARSTIFSSLTEEAAWISTPFWCALLPGSVIQPCVGKRNEPDTVRGFPTLCWMCAF